jgi:hypothetical protein
MQKVVGSNPISRLPGARSTSGLRLFSDGVRDPRGERFFTVEAPDGDASGSPEVAELLRSFCLTLAASAQSARPTPPLIAR